LEDKIIQKVEEKIEEIISSDINQNNLEHLYKLSKIKHLAKEDKEMYGNYEGRRPGYETYGRDNYGEYGRGSYGVRGRDMRYRGDDEMDRMRGEYERYMESRSRYGAGEETNRSFHYMVKALEDFIKVLHEEADTPQQKQMLNETLQRSMR
jgi:hypothetical protein